MTVCTISHATHVTSDPAPLLYQALCPLPLPSIPLQPGSKPWVNETPPRPGQHHLAAKAMPHSRCPTDGPACMRLLQVTWIGYPNSTGLPAVDYRLTDSTCDPHTTTQTFSERLVRLPGGCFLAYTPPCPGYLPPVGPLPALANGFVTFGSFNALAKITPALMRLWARILAAVPHARLLLKNKPLACQETCRAYLRQVRLLGDLGGRTCAQAVVLSESKGRDCMP